MNKEPKTIPVSFRLPADIHADFYDRAEKANLSVTDFLKEAVIKNRSIVLSRPSKTVDAKRLVYLYNKTSNNLNQIAKKTNIDWKSGVLSESGYRNINAQLNAIRLSLKRGIHDAD
ncbi:plasmid mobilization protein [Dongshaea marina]|uniref:plasmid mobilization protein n=1 Tax=Dongshaea marina TaxID=2047966 RepID=UPI000D3E1D59|nr:plasmid mobilization relaxosome protein MobC [Dongshaea marina]